LDQFSKYFCSELLVHVCSTPAEAAANAHAIVVLTEWDEFKVADKPVHIVHWETIPCFKELDYEKLYAGMKKPACLFDGRRIVDQEGLRKIGFRVFVIGSASSQALNFFP
jgi:UDPglucose 6-dehydrogenase